jgi:quercetin dioxygenase-like cupin family protein
MKENKLVTVSKEQGENISMVGDTYRIVVTGEQTNGEFSVVDMLIPPNGGPGPHAHPDFNESFYIIEGEIEVKSEEGTYIAKKNSFVNIPKGGLIHMFKNKTGSVAHMLCTLVPAGEENFFKEIGKPVAAGMFLPPPEMTPDYAEKIKKIAEKYNQKLYPPEYLNK